MNFISVSSVCAVRLDPSLADLERDLIDFQSQSQYQSLADLAQDPSNPNGAFRDVLTPSEETLNRIHDGKHPKG